MKLPIETLKIFRVLESSLSHRQTRCICDLLQDINLQLDLSLVTKGFTPSLVALISGWVEHEIKSIDELNIVEAERVINELRAIKARLNG